MTVPDWLENGFCRVSDFLMEHLPGPPEVTRDPVRGRLIAHRGIFDNREVFENTLAAFDRARASGIWGIEFDIRWTSDFQPVVLHDPDLRRFSAPWAAVEKIRLEDLRKRFPQVPTLGEVVRQFGRRTHLMGELKPHRLPADRANDVLSATFSQLTPIKDFHLLSFDAAMLSGLSRIPAKAKVLLAQTNAAASARTAINGGYGGLAGHYLLIPKTVMTKLAAHHIAVGTGFVNSQTCLYREINRGVTWLFSDRAAELRRMMAHARLTAVN